MEPSSSGRGSVGASSTSLEEVGASADHLSSGRELGDGSSTPLEEVGVVGCDLSISRDGVFLTDT